MMRTEFLVVTLAMTGCVNQMGMGDDDGVGDGRWTAVPLVDDTSNPSRTSYRKDNDLVSGIYFESADKGFVVTQGAGETSSRGGAIFRATGTEVTGVLFGGDGTGLTLSGGVDFYGISPMPGGYIAHAHASDVISSNDGGASFAIAKNSAGQFGIEPVLAYSVGATGTTIVRKTGVVTTSTSAPGPSTSYTDIWAPNATPSIPATVPVNMCQDGPLGTGVPTTHDSVYVAKDRNFIAYTANPNHKPEICISTDGGRSFLPHPLDVPTNAEDHPSTGVLFTSATTGIAWFGAANATPYVKRTTDGGATWTEVALPADLASHGLLLTAGFFAPDGQHGYIAGFDSTAGAALLLATTDAGATWKADPDVAAAVDAAGGDKLYSGFALDADRVWLGGARGLLLHN